MILKRIFKSLTSKQKQEFLSIHLVCTVTSFLELLSISLVGPYISLILNDNPESFIRNYAIFFFGDSNTSFYFGAFLIFLILFSSLVSIFNTYNLAIFSAKTGARLSNRLLQYYGNRDYLFYIQTNSSAIVKNLTTECIRFSDLVLNPIVQMNSKIILSFVLLTFLLLYDFKLTLFFILFITFVYTLIYLFVRGPLAKNGLELTDSIKQRFSIVHEFFAGIKEILFFKKQDYFIESYQVFGNAYYNSRGKNHALSLIPRNIVEFSIYTLIIVSALVLLRTENIILVDKLLVFVLISLKLLPALQQVYTNYLQVKGNISCFDVLEKELLNSINFDEKKDFSNDIANDNLGFKSLSISNLSFTYPKKSLSSLDKINLEINFNDSIGIVGSSGSGKSTLVNIILGMLEPDNLDSISLYCASDISILDRSKLFGYVPQQIYLRDASIIDNIAFGIPKTEINMDSIERSIKLANLLELVNSLSDGLNTKVGERGIQLSGGQIQRIGIARALYFDPEILIFDEATSALDGASEKEIHNAINQLADDKTIIIVAHRLNTVKKCNKIYVLDSGKVIQSGSYEEISSKEGPFRSMLLEN
jgi:ABC-type multidrug transport system fused ATPase/permease subunit